VPDPITSDLHKVVDDYRATASSTADLLAAEINLAASSAVLVVALGLAISLFAVTAWIIGMLALVAAYVGQTPWPLPLALVAGLNLVAAYGAWLWLRSLVPDLTFRELRRLLRDRCDASAPAAEGE
jgi:hypothetical protein